MTLAAHLETLQLLTRFVLGMALQIHQTILLSDVDIQGV